MRLSLLLIASILLYGCSTSNTVNENRTSRNIFNQPDTTTLEKIRVDSKLNQDGMLQLDFWGVYPIVLNSGIKQSRLVEIQQQLDTNLSLIASNLEQRVKVPVSYVEINESRRLLADIGQALDKVEFKPTSVKVEIVSGHGDVSLNEIVSLSLSEIVSKVKFDKKYWVRPRI